MTTDTTGVATADEVRSMRVAGAGLTATGVQGTLRSAGVHAPRGLASVPSRQVALACTALCAAYRDDIRSPAAPHLAWRSSLEHGDVVDGWPGSAASGASAPASVLAGEDLATLREAAGGLSADQVTLALNALGIDGNCGLEGVPQGKVGRAALALRHANRSPALREEWI